MELFQTSDTLDKDVDIESIFGEPESEKEDYEGRVVEEEGESRDYRTESDDVVDDEKLVRTIETLIRITEKSVRTHRANSEESWAKYNGTHDFAHRKKWQSQEVPPKVHDIVEKSTASAILPFSAVKEWFDLDLAEDDSVLKPIITRATRYHLRESDFAHNFEMAFKASLLSALMIIRVGWTTKRKTIVENKQFNANYTEGVLDIEVIDPDKIIRDPTGKNKWLIVERKYYFGEFMKMVREGTYSHKDSILEKKDEIRRMTSDDSSTDSIVQTTQVEYAKKNQNVPDDLELKEIVVQEFWGDLYDQDTGELIMENCTCLLVNNTHVLQKPIPNPNKHQMIPYVICGLQEVPFSVYHKSPISASLGMLNIYIEFFNTIVDGITIATIPQFYANVDNLEDGLSQIYTGIYPGKTWLGRGDSRRDDTISEIPLVGVNPQAFTLLDLIDREIQLSTALPTSQWGVQKTRGRMTARESLQNASNVDSFFSAMANHIDGHFLTPLMKLIYLTVLEHQPMYPDRTFAKEVFGENNRKIKEFVNGDSDTRRKMLASNVSFRSKVLTGYLSRQKDIEKITSFTRTLTAFLQIPGVMQELQKSNNNTTFRIKWNNIVKKLFQIYDVDTEDFYEEKEIPQQEDTSNVNPMIQQMGIQMQDQNNMRALSSPPVQPEGMENDLELEEILNEEK